MNLKTLLTIGTMTLAAGLLPAGVGAAPSTPPAPAIPLNASAFANGSVAQVAEVAIVRRRHRRGYYGHRHGRVVRRVYVDRYGRRHVVVRRVY